MSVLQLSTISTALSVVLAILLYFKFKRKNSFWHAQGVIGPEPHFLFGNFKQVILRRVTLSVKLAEFYNAFKKQKVVGLFRFNSPMLLIRDLDVIQNVFIRDFDSFTNRGLEFGGRLRSNLANSSDDAWRILRTRLSPIFTSGKLKNMIYLIENCGDQILNYLDSLNPQQLDLDIVDVTQKYTIGSITACAFGLDVDMKHMDKDLLKIEKQIFRRYLALELFFICPNLLHKLGFSAVPEMITNYFCNIVELIKKQRNGVPSGRKDFMDLLLEMKNSSEIKGGQKYETDDIKVLQITDDLIAAQVMIFYAGGFETSATTLSFLLYELAKHQEIQEKLVIEINNVLEQNNGKITMDTLKQMIFLSQVLEETLRMYPLFDLQRKVSARICKVPGTDITLERDTHIYVSARGIHYDEEYYPEPYKFDPQRFSPENVKLRHPCAYMPFGLGPRHCIGMRFAKVQSKIFLIKFLRRYKVEPSSNAKEFEYDPMRITLKAKDGVPLRISKRK